MKARPVEKTRALQAGFTAREHIHQGKATEDHQEIIARQRAATRWRWWEITSFVIGMICFVAGSFLIAYVAFKSRRQ